jgi:hypothetical protein
MGFLIQYVLLKLTFFMHSHALRAAHAKKYQIKYKIYDFDALLFFLYKIYIKNGRISTNFNHIYGLSFRIRVFQISGYTMNRKIIYLMYTYFDNY